MRLERLTLRQDLRHAAIGMLFVLGGCVAIAPQPPGNGAATQAPTVEQSVTQQARERPPIRTSASLYEGGLWRGTASWGNLMRDHRARFNGDLLTVRELNKIINVPDVVSSQAGVTPPGQPAAGAPAPGAPGAAQAPEPEQPKLPTDPILRFLEEQRLRREQVDKEQAEILRTLDQVEVQVVRVLQNGNLLVRGTHPPIFRDNNRVKYLFSINGIVRPSDVDDNNTITSTKLSKAEYKLSRLVRRPDVMPGTIARAAGAPREGALLDRFTDFLTTPSPGTVGTSR